MNDNKALEEYVLAHTEPEGEYLHRLWRATHLRTLHGHMTSGHLQGRLLKMIVEMVRPHHILEIGTFSGYSAICMAQGLQQLEREEAGRKGCVHTFEVNDEMEDFTRTWIERSGVARWIDFSIGDAKALAPALGIRFDMAFIDGNKRTYLDDYEMTMGLLKPGGFIVADNTLWDGHVVDPAYGHDRQTEGIDNFNDAVAKDPRVEQVMLPVRDGLTLIRKKTTGEGV